MTEVHDQFGRYWQHVEWIDQNLPHFVQGAHSGEPQAILDRIQRLGELALIYRARVIFEHRSARARHPDHPTSKWRDVLVQGLADNRLRQQSRKHLHETFAWLVPYIVLRELHGLNDEWHNQSLKAARAVGYPSLIEAVPYRHADYLYIMGLAGEDTAKRLSAALKRTYLAAEPNAVYANRESIYAATHAVLYASDFGTRSTSEDWLTSPRVIRFLEVALLRSCRRKDWDLVGELLTCMKLVPRPFNPSLVEFATTAFSSADYGNGAVFPSEVTRRELERLALTSTENEFDALYHTTLVAVLHEIAPVSSIEYSRKERSHRIRASDSLLGRVGETVRRGLSFLGVERIEPDDRKGSMGSTFGWPDAFQSDRIQLMGMLSRRAPACVDDEAMAALARSVAAEHDYASAIGIVGWYVDLEYWDESATDCIELLINHQASDGSIGLFADPLSATHAIDELRVSLTRRFLSLASRLPIA